MEKFDLKKYEEQLEKIKLELEKNLNMKEEVSAGEKIVETNVEVSEEEKAEAMKSLLKDSKQVYAKLKGQIRKLKLKSFFRRILGLILVGASWLSDALIVASFVALIGGFVTLAGTGIVGIGASLANNAGLSAICTEIFKVAGLVTLVGGVSTCLSIPVIAKDHSLLETLGDVGYDLADPLPVHGDIVVLCDEAKEMYKNLKVKNKQEKIKTEGVTV